MKEADSIVGLTPWEWRVNNLHFIRMNTHCLADSSLHTLIVLCNQYAEWNAGTYRREDYTLLLFLAKQLAF